MNKKLLLTYKIYTLVDLRMFENVKLPDFKGFHSQEVELPNDRRWALEHYKGRNYQYYNLSSVCIVPATNW